MTIDAVVIEGTARVHEVQLTGLSPATRYHHRVHTGATASETYSSRRRPRATPRRASGGSP